jgi:RNA polymerase primary sigma factor
MAVASGVGTTCTIAARRPRTGREGGLRFGELERELYERIPEEIGYVWHPSFGEPGVEEELFAADRTIELPTWQSYTTDPEVMPPPVSRKNALSPGDEALLFLRYNYARYRLAKLRAPQRRRASAARASQMARWYRRAMQLRTDAVRANLGLVLSMAKRTRTSGVEFGELVSEGSMALLRSVDKFDVSRGFKFSTYACRAILKSFARTARKARRYRQYFPAQYDPDLDRSDRDVRRHEIRWANSLHLLREVLADNHAYLTDVEMQVVSERFAICPHGRGQTLAQVAWVVGLSPERVRQIQNRALVKLRSALMRLLA